jgi:hypothetical protein
MARKIIVLDQQGLPSDANFRVAYWLDVPVARQPFYADAAATSVVIGPNGTTAGELSAIRSGAVMEVVEVIPKPAGTTAAQLRATAEARFAELQNTLNTQNKWSRYGSSFDGTAWTNVTVA